MTQNQIPHRIRLRGPWQFAWRTDEPVAGTMQHPEEWPQAVGNRSGTIEMTRRFHAPTNIDATDEVFVVLTGVHGEGSVQLNDESLGDFDATRTTWDFCLPRDLPRFNELAIVVTFPAANSQTPLIGLHDVVMLEIRSSKK